MTYTVGLEQIVPSLRRQYVLERVAGRDGWSCFYCGALGDGSVHLDHVVPRSNGGSDEPDNLVISCEECNRAKGMLPGWWFILSRATGIRAHRLTRFRLWQLTEARKSANSEKTLCVLASMGAGGFEPPSADFGSTMRPGTQPGDA